MPVDLDQVAGSWDGREPPLEGALVFTRVIDQDLAPRHQLSTLPAEGVARWRSDHAAPEHEATPSIAAYLASR